MSGVTADRKTFITSASNLCSRSWDDAEAAVLMDTSEDTVDKAKSIAPNLGRAAIGQG
jgi:hypothetical protein